MRVLLILLTLATPAVADVHFGEPFFEVSAEYDHAPMHLGAEFTPMVASGIHVTDRMSLFPLLLAQLFKPVEAKISPTESREVYRYEGLYFTSSVVETRDKTPDEIAAETKEAREKWVSDLKSFRSFSGYHADLHVWFPHESLGNVRGGAFEMSATLVAVERFAVEVGFGWEYMKADVCGDKAMPTTCRYKFLGFPLRGVINTGRAGWIDFGIDLNGRFVDDAMGLGSSRSRIHVGMNVNIVDRLFVRGRVMAGWGDFTRPGYGFAIGGRL